MFLSLSKTQDTYLRDLSPKFCQPQTKPELDPTNKLYYIYFAISKKMFISERHKRAHPTAYAEKSKGGRGTRGSYAENSKGAYTENSKGGRGT